jgi:oligopeptidase B
MLHQAFRAVALLAGTAFLFLGACNSPTSNSALTPPMAKKIDKEISMHGHTRVDPWYWLNQREDTAVLNYLEAENAYTEAMTAHTAALRDTLYEEFIGRVEQNEVSAPYSLNGYSYYSRFDEGQEYPLYLRKALNGDTSEQLMLDVPAMASGHAYYHVSGLSVSENNRYLAFGVDQVSRRQYTLMIKDLNTGEILEDRMPNTNGYAVWAADDQTLFYTVKDPSLRSYRVMKHRIGRAEDQLVFEEKDATYSVDVYLSKSREYIIIGSSSTMSDEYRILKADDPDGQFRIFQERERGHEHRIDHGGGYFYVVTNWKAMNFRLMRCRPELTSKGAWEEVIPARTDTLVQGIQLFRDFLVVEERSNGLVQYRVMPSDGGNPHYVQFWEETYFAHFSQNLEYSTDQVRFEYSSLTTPMSTFDYDLNERKLVLLKRQKVIGDFDPDAYHAERRYFTSHDGVKVPVSLVYRKDKLEKGAMPTVLYGYGSYGYSTDAYFSSARLSLLDRGFIFAIAHVRGGQEMGRQWYEDGKLLKKKNTFLDFIACAEGLIANGYTTADHMYAIGGSAGGLLVGAVANMRPELFRGIVAQVPFVDVVTTMLDETIPLTTSEFDEWGNPADKEYYDYMLSYSPYDNVEAKAYPALLVTTGLHDSQVQYWEPAKWVAKLRSMKTDNNPLLLHTDMETGHGGASGRFSAYREVARYYAFLLDLERAQK